MFVRVKKVGPYQYLQIAQNRREGKRVKQSIIATLGRLDKLTATSAPSTNSCAPRLGLPSASWCSQNTRAMPTIAPTPTLSRSARR